METRILTSFVEAVHAAIFRRVAVRAAAEAERHPAEGKRQVYAACERLFTF